MDANTKWQISAPPHGDTFFAAGEFVYDPDAAWDSLRSGMIVNRNGDWRVTFTPNTVKDEGTDEPLASYPGRIGRHILIDTSGFGPRRGPVIDAGPWQRIVMATRQLLQAADRRRLRLEELRQKLRAEPGVDADLIDDTLRMFASMGFKGYPGHRGFWYGLSELMREAFARRDYLATFSKELLAKSRRIDHLIRHTGTVGSYREELLRGTIRQLLPTRFQASTGFIENSPRQLDIIVWDAANYAPSYRRKQSEVLLK